MRINRGSNTFLYCRRIAFMMRKIFDENKNFVLFLGVIILLKYDVIGLWLAAVAWILSTMLWDYVFKAQANKQEDKSDKDGDNE